MVNIGAQFTVPENQICEIQAISGATIGSSVSIDFDWRM
jgi:hypothetical protein